MLDKDKIMEEAMIRCYREMYRKAQPRGDFDRYRRMIKNGQLPKDTRIYERHYLPQKEFEYILNILDSILDEFLRFFQLVLS